MSPSRFSALGLFLAVILCFQTARAQQTNSPDNDQTATEAALREKAYALLDSLSGQLGSLQSAENRARMGANIAESIWSHDEKHARALFALVETDIAAGLTDPGKDRYAQQTFLVFIKLRLDTIDRIAKHDPELAFSFLKQTRPVINNERDATLADYQEQELELRLAKRLAAKNPEIAVKLATLSLDQRISNDVLPLLLRLSGKDKHLAAGLFREVVARLRDADLANNWDQAQVATTLARVFTPPVAEESTYKELLEILLRKALDHGCARKTESMEQETYFCSQIAPVLPLMETFSLPQIGSLKQWTPSAEFVRSVEPSRSRGAYEIHDAGQNGSVDDLLGLLPKYPELEAEIRERAVRKAAGDGDFDRAHKILSEYRGDPNIQREIAAELDAAYSVANQLEEKLEDVEKKISQFPLAGQINVLLSFAAETAPKNPKLALRVLTQLGPMVDALPAGEEQLRSQVRMALIYCQAKSDRGFAMMESLLPRLNELVAAAAKLDGFDTHYLRDGEWNMSGEGATGNLLTMLANNAGYFAWSDLDRAVTLAGQFDRAEIRMMAQLKLAQGILAGPRQQFSDPNNR